MKGFARVVTGPSVLLPGGARRSALPAVTGPASRGPGRPDAPALARRCPCTPAATWELTTPARR
ncbi:hypothetical protein Sfr7A_20710 [Streptomyces xinghaiensis]|uniref:Uncharacterized protein n=1 Tax=Streptomyces xinghaiensis TaxID=1038928 RepID=A0A420V1D3_9ACTN|nr:hypothetical protein BEN35_17445 [Streptomyces fradiae]PQM21492.1 hypothetical protein Sfr7A_20710 [Streptomyces xinghaiensis]RKM94449.1 hypothetical protein SFRA_018370 [Streptomyces xinghaiensis]RNC72048.1 hypothetical protein DC095_020570 [Streptomyces xinghaiensis]